MIGMHASGMHNMRRPQSCDMTIPSKAMYIPFPKLHGAFDCFRQACENNARSIDVDAASRLSPTKPTAKNKNQT